MTRSEKYLKKSIGDYDTTSGGALDSQDAEELSNHAEQTNTSISWFIFKTVIALAVLSGVIWLVSKFLKKTGFGSGDSELMNIRSTLPLGQNQYLQIVQVGKQF
ncbi:MAG: FliO/MopB family protein, partial [bacterium]